jgi:predicted hydrolase (HD superfamily)
MKRVIDLLNKIDRPGTDNLINYLNASSYGTARCYSHHKERGGLVAHSLEMYELMKRDNPNLPEESLSICALLHDLGKARLRGWEFEGRHPSRAIQILERCHYELTEEEAFAIRNHHRKSCDVLTHPLRRALTKADMQSTGAWKRAHTKTRGARRIAYDLFSRCL